MQGYILEIQDKEIVDILNRVYITEDFKDNIVYLANKINIPNSNYNIKFLTITILKIIHLILIDNIYRYITTNQYDLLLHLIQNKLIQNDLVVKNFYVTFLSEEIKENIVFTIFDYDDYYNTLNTFLHKIILDIFHKEDSIYTALLILINTLLSKIPIFKEGIRIMNIQNRLLLLNTSDNA